MTDFSERLGIQVVNAGDGEATLELEADESHLNSGGTVHGGVFATLVDVAMGHAIRSMTDDQVATSQLSIVYLRAGRPGRLTVTGHVRKQGENIVLCDADVEQDGKALIHAVATFATI